MDYTKIDFNKWQPFSAWVDSSIEKQALKVNENRYPKPNLNNRQTQIYKESLLSQIQHLKKKINANNLIIDNIMIIIGGLDRSAKWVDENWMKIASDPTQEIIDFIEKKCTECLNSEFVPQEVERICRQWMSYCNTQKTIDDELL